VRRYADPNTSHRLFGATSALSLTVHRQADLMFSHTQLGSDAELLEAQQLSEALASVTDLHTPLAVRQVTICVTDDVSPIRFRRRLFTSLFRVCVFVSAVATICSQCCFAIFCYHYFCNFMSSGKPIRRLQHREPSFEIQWL
jgi:hypothetical protein